MRVADVHSSWRESTACDPHLSILKQLFAWVLALPFDSQGVRHFCRLRDSDGYGDRCRQYGNLGDLHASLLWLSVTKTVGYSKLGFSLRRSRHSRNATRNLSKSPTGLSGAKVRGNPFVS